MFIHFFLYKTKIFLLCYGLKEYLNKIILFHFSLELTYQTVIKTSLTIHLFYIKINRS